MADERYADRAGPDRPRRATTIGGGGGSGRLRARREAGDVQLQEAYGVFTVDRPMNRR